LSDDLVLRPRLYAQLGSLWFAIIYIVGATMAGTGLRGTLSPLLVAFGLGGGLYAAARQYMVLNRSQIILTADHLGITDGYSGKSLSCVPQDVVEIVVSSSLTILRGASGRDLVSWSRLSWPGPNWTIGQLRAVAARLGVPLDDDRRWRR
jgi:hypothetical protein